MYLHFTFTLAGMVKQRTGLFSLPVHIGGRNEAQALVNGLITEFNEFMMDFNGVRILKCRHTSIYTVIFKSGISVFIEQADNILEIMLQVPSTWKGIGVLISVCLSGRRVKDSAFLPCIGYLCEDHCNYNYCSKVEV